LYKREYSFPNTKLRYDIILLEKNIIIEVDGNQHFKGNKKWGSSNDIRARDIQKMTIALTNGYNIIRIKQNDIIDKSKFEWRIILEETLDLLMDKKNTLAFIAEDIHSYDKFYKSS